MLACRPLDKSHMYTFTKAGPVAVELTPGVLKEQRHTSAVHARGTSCEQQLHVTNQRNNLC